MEFTATIKSAAAVVAAIGSISGGALYLDHLHAPREQMEQMQSADRVNTILQLVEQAHHEGADDWLCRAIEAEFIQLCTDRPDHYLCVDPDARHSLKRKAGCAE